MVAAAIAVIVAVAGVVAIGRAVSTSSGPKSSGSVGSSVVAPAHLPPGFVLRSAMRGSNPGIAEPATLYATPDRHGGFGAPALLVGVGFDRTPGAITGFRDRTVQRHDRYPGSIGMSIVGARGSLLLAGWGVPDLAMVSVAARVELGRPGAPQVSSDLLLPGMVLVGHPTIGTLGGAPPENSGYREEYAGPAGEGGEVPVITITSSAQPHRPDAVLASLYATVGARGAPACPPGSVGRSVRVGADPGWVLPRLGAGAEVIGAADHSIVWSRRNQVLRLDATGISEQEALAVAGSMREVDASSPAKLRTLLAG
jgi:hypothetical protein